VADSRSIAAPFFTAGYLFGIVGTIALIWGADWGMYLVTAAYVFSLVAGIWNAWMMMLGIGRDETKHTR